MFCCMSCCCEDMVTSSPMPKRERDYGSRTSDLYSDLSSGKIEGIDYRGWEKKRNLLLTMLDLVYGMSVSHPEKSHRFQSLHQAPTPLKPRRVGR